MDSVGAVLEMANCLWNCSAKQAAHIIDLEQNLNSLRCELQELKDLSEDVKRRAEVAQQQQMLHTRKQVESWLQKALVLEDEVGRVLERGEREIQSKCVFGCCPKNCRSSYKTGKEVARILVKVKEEKSKGFFDVVADELPCQLVDERPMEKTVGLDLILEDVWKCLNEDTVGILGLYGMGGVGKTTLLTKLNNAFANRTHDFKLVIWVLVSRQARVEEVQEVIRNRLDIEDRKWLGRREDEKAAVIFNILKRKKFALLLDDIWERLDLLRVGVPLPTDENRCKVVFTTRSQEVCCQMEAKMRIKVTCLGWQEAFTLFKEKVGEEALNSHPEIPELAEIVAKECDGLPLALITIGRAMSSKKSPQEWRHAIEVLRNYPSRFAGMANHVFPILKFSYDSLLDDTIKCCFLYCCIFPEDFDIPKDNLVELWLGEGFLDESDDLYEARNQGIDIIESLKLACLLETGYSVNTVRMHDVIRDMALWLACANGTKRNKVIVHEYTGAIYRPAVEKWNEAERVTLWGANRIGGSPSCPDLLTLFVRNCKLKKLPSQFFQHMPTIRVLDLSNNRELVELPVEIKQLVTLEYLNLSNTGLTKLPRELGSLIKMRHMLLECMTELIFIPQNVISKFSYLRVLSIIRCESADEFLDVVQDNILSGGKVGLLDELEHLGHLSDLCLTLSTAHSVRKLLESDKFRKCIRLLCLKRCQDMTEIILSSSSVEQMKNLEKLELRNCRQLGKMQVHMDDQSSHGPASNNSPSSMLPQKKCFSSLHSVFVTDSPLLEMTWLVYAPTVEILQLHGCKLLEEVICDRPEIVEFQNNGGIFSRLKNVTLLDLPNIKSIFPGSLPFPALEEISVTLCPNLRKLPFNSTGAISLKKITGSATWWNQLRWEDETIEPMFRKYFSSAT
ncbi:hypothetical protein Ancab_029906 [Ancistrocladus abbreviatus]